MVDLSFSAINIGTFIVSNVPGPQHQVYLAGVPLEKMEFYLFGGVGMYFGLFSYNGMVTATVSVDESLGVDAKTLVDLFPAAFEELYSNICLADNLQKPEGAQMESVSSPVHQTSTSLFSIQEPVLATV